MLKLWLRAGTLLFSGAVLATEPSPPAKLNVLSQFQIQQHLAKFAPVNLVVDIKSMPHNEKAALAKLLEAARVVNALFLRQVWIENTSLLYRIAADPTPQGRLQLQAFLLNKGPWSDLDPTDVFVAGVPPKGSVSTFYPSGATKERVEQWMAGLSAPDRAKATGYFTTVRVSTSGNWVSVPYSIEYQSELSEMARLLHEAAALTAQPTLKTYLNARADAFLSNDYYDSDLAWMALDSTIEPTIGPYEVYEDPWFNDKAAFEAFVAVRDDAETQKLSGFSAQLQDIENHLPIDPALRNPQLGALAPIRVVNSLMSAGESDRGVQTSAYNLPNDERITQKKGTKRVMIRNVHEAKFQKVLVPIAKIALGAADQKNVAFDAFFTHTLMHELMHGLGPHNITVAGKPTTARQALQEYYNAVDEAKADVAGLFAMQYLIDKGVLEKSMEATMYTTYLASSFRSIRFGLTEAHGKGVALQINYLLDHGAFHANTDGTFSVDVPKAKDAVTALAGQLLTLEGHGDKAGAGQLIERLVTVRPEVQKVLDRMRAVPVDIAPRFVTAEQLLGDVTGEKPRAATGM